MIRTSDSPDLGALESPGVVDARRVLVEAPRWLLLGALVFAPWAYGATRPWARDGLAGLLLVAVCFWLLDCLVRRRRPNVPGPAAFAAMVLLLQGWFMAWNAHASFEPRTQLLLPIAAPAAQWPGSVASLHSRETMWWITGLLGGFLLACDVATRSVWRRRLWWTLAATGASIALFGIVQKIGGQPVLAWIWEPEKRDLANNFAAFRNRNNAGAFLNLVLPMLAGLVYLAFRSHSMRHGTPADCSDGEDGSNGGALSRAHWRKAGWGAALFLVVAGLHLNPSRASWVIAMGIATVFAIKLVWTWWAGRHRDWKQLGLGLGLAALVVGGVVGVGLLGRWESSWHRFGVQGIDLAQRSPTMIYWKMMGDAGWLGFGAGTFEAAFPGYQRQHDFGSRPVPVAWTDHFWPHAHQDYMQTVMEWGLVGTACWALLVLGGLARGLRNCARAPRDSSRHWLLFGCVTALAGVLLHALVDFPLQIASIQLYCVVLLAFCWKEARPDRKTSG